MLTLSKKTTSMNLFRQKWKKTPSQDLLIVMGDLNAMAGTDNMGNERVMERHGYGNLNERLVGLSGMNDLVIGGILFPHKDIHKIS